MARGSADLQRIAQAAGRRRIHRYAIGAAMSQSIAPPQHAIEPIEGQSYTKSRTLIQEKPLGTPANFAAAVSLHTKSNQIDATKV